MGAGMDESIFIMEYCSLLIFVRMRVHSVLLFLLFLDNPNQVKSNLIKP